MKRSPLVVGGALLGVVGALALYSNSGGLHLGTPHVGAPSTTLAPIAPTTTIAPTTSTSAPVQNTAAPTTTSPSETTTTPSTTTSIQTLSPPISGSEGEGAIIGNSGIGNSGTGNTGVSDGGSQDHATFGSSTSSDN